MTLVNLICADILNALASGKAIDLRLSSLAHKHHTSTRPVRQALDLLAQQGVISQNDSGRWQPLHRPAKAAPPVANVEPARDRLIDLLVRRSLVGDTTFLREHETAEALGLGRTALRSILAALSGEGLVIHEPRRGWRARALTQADFDAFTQVREALELLALDLAFTRIDPAMITRFEQGNAASATGTDNDLHRYLIDLAQNPYLTDFFARHGTYFELVFRWEGQDPQAAAEARQQHLAILAAIRGKNQPAARRALTAHIRGQHPAIADLMRKPSPRSPDT